MVSFRPARSGGPARSREIAIWSLAVFGWWTAQGLATASQYRFLRAGEGVAVGWGYALTSALSSAYLWVPLTAAAFWLTWKAPLDSDGWRRHVPAHLAAGIAAHLVRVGAVIVLNPSVGWYREVPPLSQLLLHNVVNNISLYWLITGVAHALHFAGQARERERAGERLRAHLARAELAALRARLHPHFLFNTLNTVASLVREDASRAERVIARLSELLRQALDSTADDEVPLTRELALVRAYLEIEEARFEDKLRVRWRHSDELDDARIPPLILQPLVENALHHGLGPKRGPGIVEIGSSASQGTLILWVEDDGMGTGGTARNGSGSGFGIAGTRARLTSLYGDRASLRITERPGGGTRAEVRLPYRTR
jgi:signal transduction histidine kinase